MRFLRNRFLVVETKTTVENGVFRQVPVSTAFFLRNVDYRHVSGEEWPMEWKFSVSDEKLSDLGDGSPTSIPKYQDDPEDSKDD